MKSQFCKTVVSCCIGLLAACTGPVIMDEEEPTQQGGDVHIPDSVPIIHEGTYASPYSVGEALTLKRGREVWVAGYMVGCVKGSMANGCNFTPEATTSSNILLADTFPTGAEYDYLYCLPVELPNGSAERDALNLYDNPENYHRKVSVQGNLTLYFSVVGMKQIADFSFGEEDDDNGNDNENEEDNKGDDETKEDPIPENSKDYPLSIAEGIRLQSEDEYKQVWIKGYIIGYTTSNGKIYRDLVEMKSAAKTNVVVADSIGEQDSSCMIAVQLVPDTSYICKAVNLYEHPENLHRQLIVKGRMFPYRGMNGCVDIPNGLLQTDSTIDEDFYFSLE